MTERDTVMLALYVVVIALGIQLMDRRPVMGMIQVVVAATLFGLRTYRVARGVLDTGNDRA